MPSQIDVVSSNYHSTGQNVIIAQKAVDVTLNWVDDQGVAQRIVQTLTFPDILESLQIPSSWLQDKLTDLAIQAARIIAGIEQP